MSDHTLLVLSVWLSGFTLAAATLGVIFTYLSVKHALEQIKIMREEQQARIMSETALVSTSEGPVLIGGPLGRFLKGATQRLYGR